MKKYEVKNIENKRTYYIKSYMGYTIGYKVNCIFLYHENGNDYFRLSIYYKNPLEKQYKHCKGGITIYKKGLYEETALTHCTTCPDWADILHWTQVYANKHTEVLRKVKTYITK